jgi:hypothetical protein
MNAPSGRPLQPVDVLRALQRRADAADPVDQVGANPAFVVILDQPFQALCAGRCVSSCPNMYGMTGHIVKAGADPAVRGAMEKIPRSRYTA